MLPMVIPEARIMLYGYASQWIGPDGVRTRLPEIALDLVRALAEERQVQTTLAQYRPQWSTADVDRNVPPDPLYLLDIHMVVWSSKRWVVQLTGLILDDRRLIGFLVRSTSGHSGPTTDQFNDWCHFPRNSTPWYRFCHLQRTSRNYNQRKPRVPRRA